MTIFSAGIYLDKIVLEPGGAIFFALTAGVLMAFGAVVYGIVLIALKLAGAISAPGYASLLVTITFLSGVQLIVIGMVGQYVARIYDEARARPLYLVREARGFSANGHAGDDSLWPAASQDSLTRGQRVPPLPPS